MDIRALPTAEATRSALETLVAGSDSVMIASAFVRQSGIEELRVLQRPLRRLQVLAGTDPESLERVLKGPGCGVAARAVGHHPLDANAMLSEEG